MSARKLKGIWPLYGGARNYVVTLKKILEKINRDNPTKPQLVSWLKNEYQVSSDSVPYGLLRVVNKCLGFIQETRNQVKLTPVAEDFLKSGDNRIVLNALRSRILGFDEILSMLNESQPLSLMEIHKGLLERLDVNWTTTTQTMYRVNWLLSLDSLTREYGKYRLTKKGPKPPPPTPSTPIEDYVKHAKALIERYPTMSESNTISTVIEPLLEVLGWKVRNLDEVHREYTIHIGEKTEYVDIALKIENRPFIFIEAKSVNTPLRNHLAQQPIRYANAGGVSWCVLMNGRELRLYNAFWKIKGIEQKMLFKLTIDEFKEKTDKLMLLSKQNVVSGKLDEEAEFEHARRMTLEWLKRKEGSIVKGVMELDPSLKEDFVKRVLRKIS